MCGIAGVISPRPVAQDRLDRMSESLRHRGPDDEGIWRGEGISLVHCRLSIIDVSGGHQPMLSEDGDLVVVYNGEIYNYPILRDELQRRGRRFRSSSSRSAHSSVQSTPTTTSESLIGDHSRASTPSGKSDTTVASPPAAGMTATWDLSTSPAPARRKAKRVPSGDQRGEASPGPWVKGRAVSPSHNQMARS